MSKLSKKYDDKTILFRTATIKREAVNEENRTVRISFSSEDPYERWGEVEILGHGKEEVDMEFMGSGSAPFLDGHDSRKQIGVIEKAWIGDDKKGRADVRFSKNTAADEVFNDIVDGIRKNISVGYEVDSYVLESELEGVRTYRAVKWTPLEASSVSIPADRTVGVGRSKTEKTKIEVVTMTPEEIAAQKAEDERKLAVIQKETRDKELHRIQEITAIGNHKSGDFKADANEAIANGMSVDKFRALVMDKINAAASKRSVVDPDPKIGMGPNDIKRYSFLNLIRAMATGNWKGAEFERECSEAFEKRTGRMAKGFFVPSDMFTAGAILNERHAKILAQRDLNTGTGSEGGYLVAEELLSSSFIDLLRNRALVMAAGARTLTDLQGDIDIPKQTGGATSYWLGAEGDDVTESQQALGQVRLSPNTVGLLTDMTRRFMLQSSISAEAFVRDDFINAAALAIDAAAINGSGAAGEPLGILNTTGIGSVTLNATNAPDWGDIVDLETAVLIDNALMGSLSYMTNATISGAMKQTAKDSGSGLFLMAGTESNGYQVGITQQVPAKHIIFGNWNDLIIAFWSGLDITVDTSTLSASGGTRIVAFQDLDLKVRHAESFADGYKV